MPTIIKILLFSIFLIVSCRTTLTSVSDIGLADNKYDKDFFFNEPGGSLDQLSKSVKMLNSIAYYESYFLGKNSQITLENINTVEINTSAINKISSTETASGTATIIYSEKVKIALITCAHIINFPDTLYTFYKEEDGTDSKYLESFTVKMRQTNLLPELTVSNEVEIIAMDVNSDIALIGREISALRSRELISANFVWGSSSELEWGTKVFIIGYPLNNKMITSGLVSPAQGQGKNYFFADAVFNRGFSGGIVLALRDGAPNFELVGMVKSGTVHRKFNVVPDYNNPDFNYLPHVPYKDKLLVEEEAEIKYGVTKIMNVETIIDFLEESREKIDDAFYNSNDLLNRLK